MPGPRKDAYCVGSDAFQPEQVAQDKTIQDQVNQALLKNDLLGASRILLNLPANDDYTYHAVTSVKLAQVQHVVDLGGVNGLHAWYRNEDDSFVGCTTMLTRPQVLTTGQ